MHNLVRRFIKTAVAFLGVGLLIGGWMVLRRELYGIFANPYEESAHTHAILVGFVMMMILGVALWMFPRPDREDTRYTPKAAEAAYWILTIATAMRVVGELSRPGSNHLGLRVTVMVASFAQIVAIGLFFYTMWSRIRPAGSRVREEKGERF